MKVKYLGHQGWQVSVGENKVILDLVGDTMGNGFLKVATSPPRKITEEMLDGVNLFIISHEHADHFDIEFLKKIYSYKPDATFLIPDITSHALSSLLSGIGFKVSTFSSYDQISIGNLEITVLPCLYSRYEPDVYALLFKDKSTGNAFYTSVDAIPTQESLDYVKESVTGVRLDNFTNNFVWRPDSQHMLNEGSKEQNLKYVVEQFQGFVNTMESSYVVLSGLGWKYDSCQMNESMFHVHHHEITLPESVEAALWVASFQDEYELLDGGIERYVGAEYSLDQREFSKEVCDEYKYSLENSILPQDELKHLLRWVEETLSINVSLGCKKLNKAMHYLKMEGEDKSFCLAILDSGRYYEYSYEFAKSAFVPVEREVTFEQLKEEYVMGLVINSHNFNGIRLCSEEAHICFEVASITWNSRDDLLSEYADVDIASILHPRYRPKEYSRYYLSQL
ncbi:TPA: hypothetical protein I7217_06210 [Vibrio vulnificus]|uniref:MBL fold metallo-hydrolase n=1 Tax=Vibrio vulnificus TaxID=672 RepID=UPI001A204D51|nr:MBL fold metallo-hydrolase [Vibrio vulnificus]WIL74407.1 MBL fold metallo-hydrolase [Vibrio vulnificus]HAS6044883.1 hypothetical protein [Vibrio vulnificus]HAT8503976.1 hypothetical protein [Vibrio vulnificus]